MAWCVMELCDCKNAFELGRFREATIVPAFGGGWWLELSSFRRSDTVRVTRQRGGESIYKSLDAAWSAAYQIGFVEVTIKHSGLLGI